MECSEFFVRQDNIWQTSFLNLKKCKYMLFGTGNQLSEFGSLSVSYDAQNPWTSPIIQIPWNGPGLKTYAKIRLLGRVRHILDQGTALTLYKTLILPIYNYCDYVYYCIMPMKERYCKSCKTVRSALSFDLKGWLVLLLHMKHYIWTPWKNGEINMWLHRCIDLWTEWLQNTAVKCLHILMTGMF